MDASAALKLRVTAESTGQHVGVQAFGTPRHYRAQPPPPPPSSVHGAPAGAGRGSPHAATAKSGPRRSLLQSLRGVDWSPVAPLATKSTAGILRDGLRSRRPRQTSSGGSADGQRAVAPRPPAASTWGEPGGGHVDEVCTPPTRTV